MIRIKLELCDTSQTLCLKILPCVTITHNFVESFLNATRYSMPVRCRVWETYSYETVKNGTFTSIRVRLEMDGERLLNIIGC